MSKNLLSNVNLPAQQMSDGNSSECGLKVISEGMSSDMLSLAFFGLKSFWPISKAAKLPARTLAYIGDVVFELGMRLALLETSLDEMGRLHSSVVGLVNADHQAALFDAVFPTLSEPEQNLMKSWRNTKLPTRFSGSSRGVYARATAFEALIGYLFLTGQHERYHALLKFALKENIAQNNVK